ncbi:PPOX class F420-dependent oxidoreductase [Humidisolicoccus flavus]|uniref:PPOX class F420-dependent oxidoreductase n=1 Tax=Humidisolicoccus flavus TaxID=3111414 RepID=UPI003247D445
MSDVTMPEEAGKLFDEANYVTVASLEPNGDPQLSIVWAKRDGDDVVFSTTHGRRKTENWQRDARAAVSVFSMTNPFHYAEVRGRVTIVDDPDGSLIQELSLKYTGQEWAEDAPAGRVIVRVTPHKVYVR